MKNFSIIILSLLALSSCLSKPESHGYTFEGINLEQLQEQITSKERVLKVMGSPSLISDLDNEEAWIYYSENTEGFLFFRPKVTERNVLVLRFDESETLKELQKLSFENEEKKLQFVSNHTKVETRKIGFFKAIFSNVGQVKTQ